VGANLELAASDDELDGDTANLVDAARRATERMSRTVDDLAGHGRLAVTPGAGPLQAAAVVQSLVGEHAGPARSGGLMLQCDVVRLPALPAGDHQTLRTSVGNLLANAVRLAPAGSVVRVDGGQLGSWAWIAVSDEGPGMARRYHGRVFERGWRGRHEQDRATAEDTGRGLGLTITRQLIEAAGGRVTIESAEGSGSTFTVWLPLDESARTGDVVSEDGVHPSAQPWLRTAAAR